MLSHKSGTMSLQNGHVEVIDTTATTKPKVKEWTAWECYKRDHQDWPAWKALGGFMVVVPSVVVLMIGGLCVFTGAAGKDTPWVCIATAVGGWLTWKLK